MGKSRDDKIDNKLDKLPAAVVLGLGITGLGVVRNLGRNGIKTIGVDFNRYAPGCFSRYCHRMIIADIQKSEENFLELLIQLAKKMTLPPVLFPTEDRYVMFMNDKREILSSYYKFALPEQSLCDKILNKYRFFKLAEQNTFSVPRTFFVKTTKALNNVSNQLRFPCIIKPIYSKKWSLGPLLKAVKINNKEELFRKFKSLAGSDEVVVQEIVLGEDNLQFSYCAYFDLSGKHKVSFVAKKIRQNPLRFGVGTLVESIEDDLVAVMGKKVFEQFGVIGIAEVEFRKSNSDGELKLIEINLRPWTQNTLAARCGVNIIYFSYLDIIGKSIPNSISYQAGIKWINILRDTVSAIKYILRKDLSLQGWIKSFKRIRDFAIFAFDDILPFLWLPLYFVSYFSQSEKKR